jgi:phage shock protein C
MVVYCQRCASGMPPSAHFCSNCGAVIPPLLPNSWHPLIRPRVGRCIGGVCMALAIAQGWDVTLVRVLAVLGLIFSSGLFGFAYLIAWICIPEEPWPLPGPHPYSGV